jgi:NAD(P)-dependent dehydrogenase (short-subunit alcohol dehydrogenase family)
MEHRDLVGATEEKKADILKKIIRPEEIAHAILYLVSDQAALTTATILVMDNGSSSGESSKLIVRK